MVWAAPTTGCNYLECVCHGLKPVVSNTAHLRRAHTRATHLLTYDDFHSDPIPSPRRQTDSPQTLFHLFSDEKSTIPLISLRLNILSSASKNSQSAPLLRQSIRPQNQPFLLSTGESPTYLIHRSLMPFLPLLSRFFCRQFLFIGVIKTKSGAGMPRLTLSVVVTDSNKQSASLPVRRQGTPRGL